MRTLCGTILAAVAIAAKVAVADIVQGDAAKMGAEMMNPGNGLGCLEREGSGEFKVLIYGNSIALHAPKADIGWTNCWGMAASAPEKDFAHLVVAGLEKRLGKRADFRIRNLAVLERNFTTNIAAVADISADAAWKPDYVVIAIGENSPNIDKANADTFQKFLADIARPFVRNCAKVVMRSPFWRNPAKASCTAKAAAEVGAVYVDAGHLGEKDENKAIGLFHHDGVANHPGDLGMKRLAELVLSGIPFEQIYSVPDGERIYLGYTATVNGAAVPVSEVRCSAIPFNRRWPGRQRQVEQTELCGMVRFAFDGKATVSVTADRDFKEVKVRPLSRKVSVRRDGRTATFVIDRPGGYSVEFDGYHNNLHVFADAVKEYDLPPNAIRFGPGFHEVGIRTLNSGDTVYLDPGAIVYGGFHASNATDVAILGRGIIDGGHLKEEILFEAKGDGDEDVKNAKRVHTIDFRNCRNVHIDGPTIRDSLLYNIAMWGCEDVDVSNVKIVGQWRFNTDGIDLHNCRRARVSDCFARTFDDTFCFKAHEGYGNCEDCVFERCVAWNDWGKAFEVGVECRADHLRRLAFRDCDCVHAVAWVMDVSNVDYGRVSDVTFDGIRVEADEPMPCTQIQNADDSPFDATAGLDRPPSLFQSAVEFHHEYSKENGGKWSGGGFIDGVAVRNTSILTDGRKPVVRIVALDAKHRPKNIRFEGLSVNGITVSDSSGVELKLEKGAPAPEFNRWQAKVAMPARMRIILNEDNDHYFKLDPSLMTEQALRDYVRRYAEAGIDTISFCTSGQRCSYRSRVIDAIWDPLEDGSKSDNVWPRNAEALFNAGIDPYAVWLDQCRRSHVHAWISTRMNDMHHTHPSLRFRGDRRWATHREWMRSPERLPLQSNRDWNYYQGIQEALAWNYANPDVRGLMLALLKENAERYDAEAFELDFSRDFFCLTPGHARDESYCLTELLQDFKTYLKGMEQLRGHPIQVAVRLPWTPEIAASWGFDVRRWAKEGLVDIVVAAPFCASFQYDFPLDAWRNAVGDDIEVIPAVDQWVRSSPEQPWRNTTREFLVEWCDIMARQNADAVYLFNFPYYSQDAEMGKVEASKFRELMRFGMDRILEFKGPRCSKAGYLDYPAEGEPIRSELPVRLDGEPVTVRLPFGTIPEEGWVSVKVELSDGDVHALTDVLLNGCRSDSVGHFPITALRSGMNEITLTGRGCTVADLFLFCDTRLGVGGP